MVLGKRTREYSNDSNSGCLEKLLTGKPISPSPLRRMQEDDVSGMEAMLRRRKQPRTTPVSSSSNNKMVWTKDDELIILGSIVDYEKEMKLSHRSDWDAFYVYVKDFIEADFSRKQLTDKIRKLNKRFLGNKARCNDEEGPSFTSTEDDEIFKLSMIIWDTANETECASDENVDQAKDVPCVDHERADENVDQAKDAPSVEHEPVNENMDQAKDVPHVEHDRVDENIEQAKVDAPYVDDELVDVDELNMEQEKDAPSVEHERVVDENMEREKVLELKKDAPCVEHEQVNNADTDQEMDVPCVEHEGVNENMNQEEAISRTEDEPVSNVSIETDKGEKEKSEEEFCALKDTLTDKENNEEDGVDEFCAMKDILTDKEKEKENNEEEDSVDEYCALKDAFEATTFFQSIGKYQQKVLLENLKNLSGPRRKELADECKELIDEEMKLCAKKLSFSTKLASAWESSC
ncbi:GLABROUS1 enhancer-binding protein-like 3 isoform X2 [Raphanus sativus]|uniref:GLABROUS1 enhancer-binding protein-like 3 isoform X2 n=1 Tax=Raphanus sativus TaxID=3726 RepID=A0A6J0NHV1_RAPSA|nr:GLABROUS1 enhancer-binding protein-like 3 isoform X2 [Raphanus sativus]